MLGFHLVVFVAVEVVVWFAWVIVVDVEFMVPVAVSLADVEFARVEKDVDVVELARVVEVDADVIFAFVVENVVVWLVTETLEVVVVIEELDSDVDEITVEVAEVVEFARRVDVLVPLPMKGMMASE